MAVAKAVVVLARLVEGAGDVGKPSWAPRRRRRTLPIMVAAAESDDSQSCPSDACSIDTSGDARVMMLQHSGKCGERCQAGLCGTMRDSIKLSAPLQSAQS